jgi:hypothetical protein
MCWAYQICPHTELVKKGPVSNYHVNFSNHLYYKQQRHMWACGKELGDRKQNHPYQWQWKEAYEQGSANKGGYQLSRIQEDADFEWANPAEYI